MAAPKLEWLALGWLTLPEGPPRIMRLKPLAQPNRIKLRFRRALFEVTTDQAWASQDQSKFVLRCLFEEKASLKNKTREALGRQYVVIRTYRENWFAHGLMRRKPKWFCRETEGV